MWRSRLLALVTLVMGLAVALAVMVSVAPQQVRADDQQVSIYAVLTAKNCALPAQWEVRVQGQTQSVLVTSSTRFLPAGQTCENFVETERIRIELGGQPPSPLEATTIERFPATPSASDVTFRGTLTTNPGLNYPQYWTFETGSGRQTVYVPSASIVTPPAEGVSIRAGLKADVTATREGGALTAKSIVFVAINPEVTFSGPIQSYPASAGNYRGLWSVGGRNVLVDSDTQITGEPALYRQVTVKARIVGVLLQASRIDVNMQDAGYSQFELYGVLTEIPNFTSFPPGKVAGCIPFYTRVVIDTSWRNKSVRLIGPRNPLRLEATQRLAWTDVARDWFALQGVVEDRRASGDNTLLSIGGITFSLPNTTANLAGAIRGSVVKLTGQCQQTTPTVITPVVSTVEIKAPGLTPFTGPILSVELNPPGVQAIFTITNLLTNETQTIFLRDNRPGPTGRPPLPGAVITGEGYLQDDGRIDATTIAVVVPAMTATPTPTPIGFRSTEPKTGPLSAAPEMTPTPARPPAP